MLTPQQSLEMLRLEHLLVQQLQRVRAGPRVYVELAARRRRTGSDALRRLLVNANEVAVRCRRGRWRRGGEGHELAAAGRGVGSSRCIDEQPVEPGAAGGGGWRGGIRIEHDYLTNENEWGQERFVVEGGGLV